METTITANEISEETRLDCCQFSSAMYSKRIHGCYNAWTSILTLVTFEMVGFCLRHTTHNERGMREVQSLLEHVTLDELAKSIAQRIWVVIQREIARTILCIGLLPGLSTGLWTFSAAGLFLRDVLASSWLLVSLGPL